MRITHPQATYQGIPPEDMFFVSSEQQVQLGSGYIISFFQQEMYPNRPLNLYIQIDAQPSARSLLFGALLARAEVIRAGTPGLPARLYTQIAPEDTELAAFYERSGLVSDDAEDMFRFSLPEALDTRAPMGLQYASVPLEGDAQQDAFLQRLNVSRITPIQRDQLTLWREQPHFLALGFYRGGQPVTELLTTGAGAQATLVEVYTRREHRRQGYAKNLIALAGGILRERGAETVYTHIFRRNVPQVSMMKRLNAEYVKTLSLLPGLDL